MNRYDFTFNETELEVLKKEAGVVKDQLDVFLNLAASGKYAEASEVLEDIACAQVRLREDFEKKHKDAVYHRNMNRTKTFWPGCEEW